MTHPRVILEGWTGAGKAPSELSSLEVKDLRERIGRCNAWMKGRIAELIGEGSSVRGAVLRATSESGMPYSTEDQQRMISEGERTRAEHAEGGRPIVEIVSPAEYEQEKLRAERDGDLLMQARRVR